MARSHATGGWRIGRSKPILDFHERFPLEGYRRLTFMMLDDDIVAVIPSSVYRVLKAAGRLDRRFIKPSKNGTGYIPPLLHWPSSTQIAENLFCATFRIANLHDRSP
jgi:hypothetical protein